MNDDDAHTTRPNAAVPGPLRRAWRRAGRIASFLAWFTAEFLRANAVVIRDILSPGDRIDPAIVEIPLRSRTALELATTTSLVTLTPGTLALSLTHGDPVRLCVHGMHAPDTAAFRAELHELEERLLAALRPVDRGPAQPDASTRRPGGAGS